MDYYPRKVMDQVSQSFFKGKAVIIYGARQVGKTTLIRMILKNTAEKDILFLNCDLPDVRDILEKKDLQHFKGLVGDKKVVFIDEAQRVSDIGLTLKILIENFPNSQIIATGSSSFDLANKINEPLTGRKFSFQLYSLSLNEIFSDANVLEIRRKLPELLIYGSYPEVVSNSSLDEKRKLITEIAGDSLYKDIMEFQSIKSPGILRDLLKALALQVGSEVSYTELAQLLNIDKKTVESYVNILEKSFIIFRLPPMNRNLRNELKKLRKIYFFDLGVRNAVINNFNPLDSRSDIGQLWENYAIVEMIKQRHYQGISANYYFWKTYHGAEVDFIEEFAGKLSGYEIKWNAKKNVKAPRSWLESYPNASWQKIDPDRMDVFFQKL